MPEVREDPLTGTIVILAPGRASRPEGEGDASTSGCPFCAGNEAATPPEVYRTGAGAPDTPGWRVRVVPNLYPLAGGEVPGAHEVVVLSPDHDVSFADLDDDAAAEVFAVWRDRSAHHLERGLAHAQPFINYGKAAGASLEHPHAQLVVLDFVPPGVARALERFADAGRDLVALAMDDALDGVHGVMHGSALAWCPPASALPFQVLVAHPESGPRFDRAADDDLAPVAHATRRVIGAIREVRGDVPYNVVVLTAPAGIERGYHWYVRITPRLSVRAGFEDATGLAVNTVAPEVAAAALRDVL